MVSVEDTPALECCSLGMFIIDEIHGLPSGEPIYDAVGGAGSFFAIGARVLCPPPRSKRIGWIVDAGSDFPPHIRQFIEATNTACLVRETPHRLTTRGWNSYGQGEMRDFRYQTPKLRLDEASLSLSQLGSRSFHLICSASRCIELVNGIVERRHRELENDAPRPCFIWEPVPDLCTPEQLEACVQASQLVAIVSPNHAELAALFGCEVANADELSSRNIEELSSRFLENGVGPQNDGALVIRAGKRGCYIASPVLKKWLPAFHVVLPPQNGAFVVDTTGAGNAFLGGFAAGLFGLEGPPTALQLINCAVLGNLASSFVVEQVGMPVLGHDDKGIETWNNERASQRLQEYRDLINATQLAN